MTGNGGADTTPMADEGDARALRRDPVPGDPRGGGGVLSRPVHPVGARGDGPSVAGSPSARARTAVSGDRRADGSVDDDRDSGRTLVAPRRGRVQGGARPRGLLKVALPAKGRL